MKTSQFTRWIAQLSSLSPEQRDQLKACLSAVPSVLVQDMISTPSTPLIDADAILCTVCTDSAGVYAHFAKAEGITHRPVNPSQKRRVDGPFHIQNVNA